MRPSDSPLSPALFAWLTKNYGVATRIAKETGLSLPTVSRVLHGKRNNEVVETALAKLGAPGFGKKRSKA